MAVALFELHDFLIRVQPNQKFLRLLRADFPTGDMLRESVQEGRRESCPEGHNRHHHHHPAIRGPSAVGHCCCATSQLSSC